ncbi:MAG: hypothetical protein GQ578_05735 [Desulfuromonadaceae bacterium]|nr:hypothetical protein [Desulfuromonadaceae bacterium]
MSITKDIITLITLLFVVAAVIFSIHCLGSQVDNKSKYTHPITRPDARW